MQTHVRLLTRYFRLLLLAVLVPLSALAGTVTTIKDYGTLDSKRFSSPQGISVDANGVIVVTDTNNHALKGFTEDGKPAFSIGSSGTGLGQFSYPQAVTRDKLGNLWVVDTNNHRVQKFDQDGNSLDVAAGTLGNAHSSDYRLANPYDIKVGPDGNYWIADYGKHRIVALDKAGHQVRVIGALGANDSQFNNPNGVDFAGDGNLWVADRGNDRLQMFAPDGTFKGKFGAYGLASGDGKSLYNPKEVCPLADGVLVAYGQRVIKFNLNGLPVFILGKADGTSGPGNGEFNEPRGLAVDGSGNIYVADRNNDRIQKFTATGAFSGIVVSGFAGGVSDKYWDFDPGDIYHPIDVAIDAAGLLVVLNEGYGNKGVVQKFTTTTIPGAYVSGFNGSMDLSGGVISYPEAMTIDGTGDIWLAENSSHRVRHFKEDGTFVQTIASLTINSLVTTFNRPAGIVVSGNTVWVSDYNNDRVLAFDKQGGSAQEFPGFSSPWGLAKDSAGELWIAAYSNNRVVQMSTGGLVKRAFSESASLETTFSSPTAVTADGSGGLWVSDRGNKRVLRYDASGTLLLKIGGYNSGVFNDPEKIAVAADGSIWVADYNGPAVRHFSADGIALGKIDNTTQNGVVLNGPTGVALYQDQDQNEFIIVTDWDAHQVVKFTAAGAFVGNLGLVGSGSGLNQYYTPAAVAVSGQELLVADHNNGRIKVLTLAGGYKRAYTTIGSDAELLNYPSGVAFNAKDNTIWVVDQSNDRLMVLDQDGKFIRTVDGPNSGLFYTPTDIYADSNGHLWVADDNTDQVVELDGEGNLVQILGGEKNGNSFNQPAAVLGLADGSVWVTDTNNHRVGHFKDDGTLIVMLGGQEGNADGQFKSPQGLAVSNDGNSIYVADTENDRIQQFNKEGVFQKKVGKSGGGPGADTVDNPVGMAVDKDGLLWVVERVNKRLHAFDTTSGATVYTKGSFTTSLFNSPSAVAIDQSGKVWVTDTGNHRVMKFEPDSTTTPLLTIGKIGKASGSGAGEFTSPAGIAVDSEGHIQVADNNDRIQVFTEDGTFLRAYGGLSYPKGISISAGKVFVADGNNNRVALYLESGAFVKTFEDNGVAEDGFNNPHGVAKDSAGNLWVADFDNDRVVRLDSTGKVVQKIVEMLDGPDGLSIDGDDNLWVTSRNRHLVLKFSKTGALLKAFDNSGVAFANINDPSDMLFFQGNLYLVDRYNHRVVVQDAAGATVRTFGALGDSAGLLHEPWGITVGPDGNIWVSQTYDEKITVFTPSGDFVKTFGSYGSLNGMLNDPHGIAFGLDGNLWVVNSSAHRLDLFSQSGAYLKSVASQGSEPGQLYWPQGIAIDSQGRLFVGDTNNHRISVFDKDGNYLYVFGSSDLSSPTGMAIDSKGLLWVIDASKRELLAFDLSGKLQFKGGEYGDGVGMFKEPSALAVDAAGKVWVGDNSKDNLQGFEISQPQNLALQLLHRHWRYGAETQHIVDVPVGGLIHPQVTGSITLGETSGSGDLKSILPTTWVSTNPDVATVGTDGTITAQAAGQTEVQATINNQTLAMTVNVKAANALPVMVLGTQGDAFGEYTYPGPIWSGNGKVYVADSGNQRVTILDLTGNWLQTIWAPGYLNNIGGLVADANGVLFVSDASKHKIHKFEASGKFLLSFGEYGTANGQFSSPQEVSLDANGNLWVADKNNHRVQAFTPAGAHLGGFGSYGTGDSQLYYPSSVVVDGAGVVWVADYYHLKKFTTNGTLIAKFDNIYPRRLALDGDGAIWVQGSDSHLRKFGSDLKQLMDYDSTTSQDEPGKFYNPDGIAVDGAGHLWVAESYNHRLQRIDFIPQQLNLLSAKTVVKDEEQVDAIATYGVTETVKPSEIVNSEAVWTVDDPDMATVESGLLTAAKTGPVQVTAQYAGLSATLSLNLLATAAVEVDNVDMANAQPLNMGEAMEGSMAGNKSEDHWFAITTSTSGYYRILYSSIASQNYNTSLTIYDSQQGDPIHTISPLSASGLTVPIFLAQQKSYYVKISGYYQDTFLLSYIFVVAGEPPSPGLSATVTLGEPLSGQVAVGSSNYYKLELSGPRQLLFGYENPGSVTDMQITVYPEEVSEDTVIDRATSTAGEAKEIAIGLNQGTYYIEVKAFGNVDESTYTLTVAPNLQVGAGEYEGNNTQVFANSLADGVALTARNYSPQDVDLYTFHYAPASSSDWLTFNFTPKDANGNYTIRFLNLEGNELPNKNYSSYYGQAITSQNINMKPGQYFLEVKDSSDKRTEYTLSLAGKINKISSAKKVTGVELIPAKAIADIKVGDTVAITAKVYYSDGSVVENPETATWTGTNQEVIAVSQGQLVVAKKGAGSLVVSFEGKVATIDLDLSAVGVVKKQSYGNLIIVAGGGIEPGNKLKDITQYLSDLSYQKFKGRGFGDEDILYLNPKAFKDLDGNGFNDGIVDQTEITKAGFAQAISGWATEYPSTGPLYIYLNDHGADAQFQLYPSQVLTAAELKAALDTFQTATGRAVVVIIEACHSGTFVAPLMTGATNRVVITSSDTGLAFLGDGGSASFSQIFMGSLYKGASLSEAFIDANTALTALGKPYTGMYPQVAPASLAGSAQDFFVVGNFALAPMFPEITPPTLASTYDTTVGGGYGLQAKVTGVSNGKVWATIKPADYTPPAVSGEFATPEIQLPMVELLDADQDGVMDGTFDGTYAAFTANGVYDVVIFARDAEGNITQTPVHKLTVSGLTSSNAYLNVGLNWGLLSATVPVQVGTVFADAQKFVSIWKWESGSWSVYLPGEPIQGSYATSKNFGKLATINPGEGFWVNSKVEHQLILTGTPVLDGAMTFLPGWNLLGLRSDQPISAAALTNAQSGIVSMWKWVVSGEQVKWAVYLTTEGGSQGSYATSKGFEVLSTINPGEGFWVNKP